VRQLENAIFRAVVLAERDEIGVTELPQIAQAASVHPTVTPPMSLPMPGVEAPALAESAPALAHRAETHATIALLDALGEIRALEDIESETIRFAITHYRGQMSEVARRLQIGRSTLYRKLDTLGLSTGTLDEASSEPVVGG
jgi:DNA-binding NtrC family response regulator